MNVGTRRDLLERILMTAVVASLLAIEPHSENPINFEGTTSLRKTDQHVFMLSDC